MSSSEGISQERPIKKSETLPLEAADINSILHTEELSAKEAMAEQVRRLLAYVCQEGTDDDIEEWFVGIDEEKILAFVEHYGFQLPFEVIYFLVNDERKEVRKALKPYVDLQSDKEQWLKRYREERDILPEDVVTEGRREVTEILVNAFRSQRKLTIDESFTVQNMAQNITSGDVMRAIVPFAEKNPWIAIHLMNNVALIDPEERIENLEQEVNFTPVLESLLETFQEGDGDIRKRIYSIFKDPYVRSIIDLGDFARLTEQLASMPDDGHHLYLSLLENPAFTFEDCCVFIREANKQPDGNKMGMLMEISRWLAQKLENIARDYSKKEDPHILNDPDLKYAPKIVQILNSHPAYNPCSIQIAEAQWALEDSNRIPAFVRKIGKQPVVCEKFDTPQESLSNVRNSLRKENNRRRIQQQNAEAARRIEELKKSSYTGPSQNGRKRRHISSVSIPIIQFDRSTSYKRPTEVQQVGKSAAKKRKIEAQKAAARGKRRKRNGQF